MKVVLELQDQPSNIKKVTVRHDIVIGRGADCNLRLSAPQVSRRHCFLRIGSDGAYVSDMDSSNGTFMNGIRLNSGIRYEIEGGTILAVGPVKFVTRVESEVVVGEMLHMKIADDRIEAEHTAGPQAKVDSHATIFSPVRPMNDDSSMNFVIEQAGPSSSEDEPTADYVATDSNSSNLFGMDVGPLAPARSSSGARSSLNSDLRRSEPDTIAADSDNLNYLQISEDASVNSEQTPPIPAINEDDDMESDLRNFLNGLE